MAMTMALPIHPYAPQISHDVSMMAREVMETIEKKGLLKVLIFHLRIEGRPDCTAALLNLRSAEGQEKLDWVIGIIVSARSLLNVNHNEFEKALVRELHWKHAVPTLFR